jgi:DNA-binding transcriptional regulator YiaG
MKLIKKKGESKSFYEIQSESVVTFNEMRVCLRKTRNLQENKINSICRKLSMSKDNFISL